MARHLQWPKDRDASEQDARMHWTLLEYGRLPTYDDLMHIRDYRKAVRKQLKNGRNA